MKVKKVTCGSANLQHRRGWGGSSGGVGGRGEVGFDVSPGWRRAAITEGGKGERMVLVQRSGDELRVARAQPQQHFHLFTVVLEQRLRLL